MTRRPPSLAIGWCSVRRSHRAGRWACGLRAEKNTTKRMCLQPSPTLWCRLAPRRLCARAQRPWPMGWRAAPPGLRHCGGDAWRPCARRSPPSDWGPPGATLQRRRRRWPIRLPVGYGGCRDGRLGSGRAGSCRRHRRRAARDQAAGETGPRGGPPGAMLVCMCVHARARARCSRVGHVAIDASHRSHAKGKVNERVWFFRACACVRVAPWSCSVAEEFPHRGRLGEGSCMCVCVFGVECVDPSLPCACETTVVAASGCGGPARQQCRLCASRGTALSVQRMA